MKKDDDMTALKSRLMGALLILTIAALASTCVGCVTVVSSAGGAANHEQTKAIGSSATADLLGNVAEEAADVLSASDEIEAAALLPAVPVGDEAVDAPGD